MQQVKDESVRTNRNHLQARQQQAGALGLQMLCLQPLCPSVGWAGGLEGQGIARALGQSLLVLLEWFFPSPEQEEAFSPKAALHTPAKNCCRQSGHPDDCCYTSGTTS